MRARVPASSANLGPGFDTLAVALELYLEVTVTPSDSFAITSEGFGAGRFDSPDHLAARVVREVLGHDHFHVHVRSDIPVSRGLGSSAALAVAAAAAAGAADPLWWGTKIDGHAENAAASVLGGVVVAGGDVESGIVVRPMPLDDRWRFVVVIPEAELATADARRVLPATVPLSDAVANLSHLGLLLAGLADADAFVPGSMQDALHQPYRSPLLSFSAPLLSTMIESGAAGSCWSGAGSTMLALVREEHVTDVADASRAFVETHGVAATVRTLGADRTGLVSRDA